MNLDIVVNPMLDHHATYASALADGARRHGVEVRIVDALGAAQADVVACWGWRLGEPLRAAGKRVLVMERGYIGDRMRWTSLGWNGLNGRAMFYPFDDRSRFWRYHADQMRPINLRGDYVLLIGQVEGDAALDGVDIRAWYDETARRAAERFRLPVRFRPHPLAADTVVPGVQSIGGDLAHALDGAALVVTWNSTVGVEALLRGKPTVAMDRGSMASTVAVQDLRIELPINREAWAERLAWYQWTLDELRNGYAWDVVRMGAE